jgi:hypothetical protein
MKDYLNRHKVIDNRRDLNDSIMDVLEKSFTPWELTEIMQDGISHYHLGSRNKAKLKQYVFNHYADNNNTIKHIIRYTGENDGGFFI